MLRRATRLSPACGSCFQTTSKEKIAQFRKTSREIFPELTGLMFNEPKMQSKISVECPPRFYAFKHTVCSKCMHLEKGKLR